MTDTALAAGLSAAGVTRLVCGVHERMFPSLADEDIGAGSFASRGADSLLRFLSASGATDVQLGPPGRITEGNRSPFDGTAFARCESLLSPMGLSTDPTALLDASEVRRVLAGVDLGGGGARADLSRALSVARRLTRELGAWAKRDLTDAVADRLTAFHESARSWLEPDAAFLILAERMGTEHTDEWASRGPEGAKYAALFSRAADARDPRPLLRDLRSSHADAFATHALVQWALHEQHKAARARARSLGLRIFGDLQAGMSLSDRWVARALVIQGYAMGAPPSRTNPEGQPWGYPLLDVREPEATSLFARRVDKLLDEYDGIRLDHPHALVCPWAYRDDTDDPLAAVKAGARLFGTPAGSPPSALHPELAAFAIPHVAQLDVRAAPHADAWVRQLDDAQVSRYAMRVDAIVDALRARGRTVDDVACEVLSTQPYPLGRVLARHGIGRFRVTQKTRVDDPTDVYHFDRAEPSDWVMVGTHDTPPIWAMLEAWERDGTAGKRAAYLAARIGGDEAPAILSWLARVPAALGLLELSALFSTSARRVMLFISDWLGETAIYNRPGVVDDANWTLRVPRDFERIHDERVRAGAAFDPPAALALALARRPEHRALCRTLAKLARAPLPDLAAFRD